MNYDLDFSYVADGPIYECNDEIAECRRLLSALPRLPASSSSGVAALSLRRATSPSMAAYRLVHCLGQNR